MTIERDAKMDADFSACEEVVSEALKKLMERKVSPFAVTVYFEEVVKSMRDTLKSIENKNKKGGKKK